MIEPTPISIVRSKRSSLGLRILPGGKVEVRAPHLVPQFVINRFIASNQEWIEKRLEKIHIQGNLAKREYVDGENYLYLGEEYVLKIGDFSEILFQDGVLYFPKVLAFRVKKELETFLKKKAEELINERVRINAKKMNVSYVSVKIVDTKSRWGACSRDNRLEFSWRLIMAPLIVLNYVTVHELSHTIYKHHGKDFWSKVKTMNISYKHQIKWLKDNGARLVV